MTSMYIDDKNGNMYLLPHGKVKITRERYGRAGSMEFEYYGGDVFSAELTIENGMAVRFDKDGETIFYGYVFKVNKQSILCYDQIRYLKYSDTKVFQYKKLSEMVQEIIDDNGLIAGTITDTEYVISSQVSDQVDYLDMIDKGLETTLLATGDTYFLQDNIGQLELLHIKDTHLNLVIDGDSNLEDYDYSKEIDSSTYNRIKLFRQDSETGERKFYVCQDNESMEKWGKLQYFEEVDENLNDAQVEIKGAALLELFNKETKSLTLKNVIGDINCKSGYSVYVYIPDEGVQNWYLINKDTHTYSGNSHTMSLELAVY